MSEIRINLNEFVKVKLTDYGKEVFYHQHDDTIEQLKRFGIRSDIKPTFPEVDAEGYSKFQLWQFIQIYGEYIGMGFESVIQPLEIICEEREGKPK